MDFEYFGWAAVFFTSIQFIPQVSKAFKSKDIASISAKTYFLVCISCILWISHGIINSDRVIITANVFVMVCALAILARKYSMEKK